MSETKIIPLREYGETPFGNDLHDILTYVVNHEKANQSSFKNEIPKDLKYPESSLPKKSVGMWNFFRNAVMQFRP